MGILIDGQTRVIVQGLTGKAGTFYTRLAMDYAPGYVGGVRPGKGGETHLGLPVFDSVREAKDTTGATASMILAPAPHAAHAMIEAIEAGIDVAICVTERVPTLDMMRVKDALRGSDTELVGPNSQGILVPGIRKIGVMSTADAMPGSIGIAARSASLTSEIVAQTTAAGFGQSTTVGVGGDPIHGTGFVRCLELFRDDDATKAVVLVGELGGIEEEEAADYLAGDPYGKPVIALLVGRHAPEDRRMGHAGTVSVLGSGSIAQKGAVLEEAGATVAASPGDVVRALKASGIA